MLHTLLIIHVHIKNAVLAGFIRFSFVCTAYMNTCVKLNLILIVLLPYKLNFQFFFCSLATIHCST